MAFSTTFGPAYNELTITSLFFSKERWQMTFNVLEGSIPTEIGRLSELGTNSVDDDEWNDASVIRKTRELTPFYSMLACSCPGTWSERFDRYPSNGTGGFGKVR
jgi:hypothetical protein